MGQGQRAPGGVGLVVSRQPARVGWLSRCPGWGGTVTFPHACSGLIEQGEQWQASRPDPRLRLRKAFLRTGLRTGVPTARARLKITRAQCVTACVKRA